MTIAPTIIEFTVRGTPKPQPRAKTRVVQPKGRPAFAHIYTPRVGDEWKRAVARTAGLHAPAAPMDGPVRVELRFYLPRMKKHERLRVGDDAFLASDRVGGDCDNLAKAVVDVLQAKGYFVDDAQVAAVDVRKWYAAVGAVPGLVVRVGAVDPHGEGEFGAASGK